METSSEVEVGSNSTDDSNPHLFRTLPSQTLDQLEQKDKYEKKCIVL